MINLLDERYFEWLYDLTGASRNRNPSRSFWSLEAQLHRKQFSWFVPNDDNRIEDGKDLRFEFMDKYEIEDADELWVNLECSML